MRENKAGRTAVMLSAAVLFFIFFMVISAGQASAENETGSSAVVKAGYFMNGDFMHKDADGNYAGYDIEYYYTLAGYAGWDVQFVDFRNLEDASAALKSGQIDIMSGLSETDERKQDFIISSAKMCTSHIAVQTRADDDRYTAGDPSTMTDMTCGILKGSNVVALFEGWCDQNGLTPHVVEYDSIDLRNKALAAGEVDSIAAGSTIEGAQKIAEFPALDLYFMMNKERGDLKMQLDRAMGMLSLENPGYSSDLSEKYFPASRNTSPSFSQHEKEFISEHPVIRLALLKNDAPFSAVNKKGEIAGILPEYYDHLAEVIGTKFEYSVYDSKDEAFAALDAGEVDAVGKDEDDIFDSNSRGAILSDAFLKMNMVQVTRAGAGTAALAAVPQCNQDWVSEVMDTAAVSSLKIQTCANTEECMSALKNGSVDSIICTQPAATWILNRNRASDYVVSAFGNGTFNVVCACASDTDGNILRGILNKTITVDGSYIQHLITGDTLQDSADFSTIFDRLPVSWTAMFASVAGLMLAVAIVAIIIILRRRQTERKLAARQAELAAEIETNKARRAFFGTISHDMRTPLNGIVGFADLALESGDPSEMKKYLRKIRTSASVLSSLVSDTLIMSRVENGKYVLHPAPCEASDILDGVIEPVRKIAEEKGVRFEENVSGVCHRRVIADRLSIQKVLLNLLTNAVKFTQPGGTVKMECHYDPKDGAEPDSVIVISDTGIGMSPEFLPHVFEPFAQENAEAGDKTGSGMGLSIVKSIVDAMGGRISVKSTKGKGTVFTIRMHLQEAEEQSAAKSREEKKDYSVLRGKRALICEDNALNLEIISTILKRQGMETVGRKNGREGCDAFRESRPGTFDIIFLDLRMPVMGGLEAAKEIRAMERSDAKTVPIYAVSADAYPENIADSTEAGMNGHISKPIDASALLRTAAEAVTGGPA